MNTLRFRAVLIVVVVTAPMLTLLALPTIGQDASPKPSIALTSPTPSLAQEASPRTSVASPEPSLSIYSIEATAIDGGGFEISWKVEPPGTGQVEYGLTPAYGQHSKLEESFLPLHIQALQGLLPATTYHYRIHSSSADGQNASSADMSFRTSDVGLQPEAPTGIYGSGIAADSKANLQLSGDRVAHRFRASTSSELLSVQVQLRGGEVYSDGDGGVIEVSVQPDDGTRRHRPTGEVLASLSLRPGNPDGDWTTFDILAFPEPTPLSAGELYHVVFENHAPAPTDDYVSVNEIFTYDILTPRQVAFDEDYAVLYDSGTGWDLKEQYTADMDLAYADGTHDGQSYIQNMCDRFGVISGPHQMTRQRFTVSSTDRTVTAVSVRLKRIGGDEPVVFQLQDEDDAAIETIEVPAQDIPKAEPGCSEGGATWVTATFSEPRTLELGNSYELRLTTDSSSLYTAEPIREGTDEGMVSYRFVDGGAERSTDSGDTWTPLYSYSPVDLQFYFHQAP